MGKSNDAVRSVHPGAERIEAAPASGHVLSFEMTAKRLRGACSCGWRSSVVRSEERARERHAEHVGTCEREVPAFDAWANFAERAPGWRLRWIEDLGEGVGEVFIHGLKLILLDPNCQDRDEAVAHVTAHVVLHGAPNVLKNEFSDELERQAHTLVDIWLDRPAQALPQGGESL